MPLWVEEVQNRLQVYTPRVTDSPLFSPCAEDASAAGGGMPAGSSRRSSSSAARCATREPAPAPSCDARSAASDDQAALPVLHDLERHFCSAFLDDDYVPAKERPALAAAQRSLPAGLLVNGAVGPDATDAADKGGGQRAAAPPQQDSTLETGLSFFGPATAHSHFPEELGRLVEVHHFVAVAEGFARGAERSSLAALQNQLYATLVGVSPAS